MTDGACKGAQALTTQGDLGNGPKFQSLLVQMGLSRL